MDEGHALTEYNSRCQFYVTRKRRFCPFQTKNGAKYCNEHKAMCNSSSGACDRAARNSSSTDSGGPLAVPSSRVLCPYDMSHSVELDKLKKHMGSLCNARPPDTRPNYTLPDCNVVSLPPNYFSETFADSGQLWSEEGLAKSDAQLMVKPGELVYLGSGLKTKDRSVLQNSDTSSKEMISEILKPIITSYLRRVSRIGVDYNSQTLEGLLDLVKPLEDFRLDCRTHQALLDQQQLTKHSKHIIQQSSLIGHLDSRGLLDPQYAFVEFGAGKGELSVYVHRAVQAKPSSNNRDPSIFLVDRKNFRQKFKIKRERDTLDQQRSTAPHRQFERIYLDIRDLDLTKVVELQVIEPATGKTILRPVVAYSKHLCGAATDLTIRCLERYQEAGGVVAGIAIALCCHHICKYSMFIDPVYLPMAPACSTNNDTIDAGSTKWNMHQREMFRQIAAISTWAINGPPPQAKLTNNNNVDRQPRQRGDSMRADIHYSGLSYSQRVRAGHAVKRFLDMGRLDYVRRQLQMDDAELVYYTLRSTSPENLALLASKIA
ncbi:tRNA:m4X modification enzyme [Coemansia spiralis]|uniref:tRNA:m(4)X modification enzyme TRM13 n=2 Tax=Coemansia TaxID=4863 RepID=A0A9W8KZH7_9FUNG|nr:methyltransferase TRM13-domain-containing protein [Coemansia spiralis]KAJ1996372.1 tRNA:m4X modification enzyme [Coemansia umbellata]KAJ2624164.1 tRNA:m4X modification enzyme [Coemansia sp. RSA 1358]KAJ2680800.1 tRNA:m4X modification enzyme [Coemansia spiralis]